MKKFDICILCFVLISALMLFGCKSSEENKSEVDTSEQNVAENIAFDISFFDDEDLPTYLCGCHVDIENMKDNVDLNMDISKLSLADLRILRNVFAAQQGYCFNDSFLRHIYCATSWYEELAESKYEELDAPINVKYTDEQTKFIERIKAREDELRKLNYNPVEGALVNYKNVVNKYQMDSTTRDFRNLISKNGFVIVEGTDEQLFHVYEENDYEDFPSFVTTDMYMQLFHMYFDYLLRDLESTKLMGELKLMSTNMYNEMMSISRTTSNERIKNAAEYNATYYAIGLSLLTGKENINVPAKYADAYRSEIDRVNEESDDYSNYLGYDMTPFPYSLFRPRGHYTRSDEFKRYFKSMMWFQYVPACLDENEQFDRVIVSADVLSKNNSLMECYRSITEPIEFIVGEADNVSVLQLAEKMKSMNTSADKLLSNNVGYEKYRSEIKKLCDSQNRISPKIEVTCKDKINLMPQRYLADNEILQELVDVETKPETLRAKPMGLDVVAAFGSDAAQDILLKELKEGEKWPNYVEKFNDVKNTMKKVDWDKSMYNKWMQSLNESVKPNEKYPYFMQTAQWDKKNINAALASWSELRHDCILYAEQPFGAECGGGGMPDPIVVGYVEPNVGYWNKAIELLDKTEQVLQKTGMLTGEAKRLSKDMKEKAQFLLSVSEKELAGKKLSEQEYNQIEYIGSTFEWLTLDMINDEGLYLNGWGDVIGTDRCIAVVADVYTANASNNSNKSILYEATGYVNTIYVIVEIEGHLYLTRGAVFSYREFDLPMDMPRMTDEEWQNKLKTEPTYGVPEWMQEITLPSNAPKSNGSVFYSSGC